MQVPGLIETIRLLAAGGGVGAVLSFLLERVPWFQRLGSQARYYVILAVSVGLPVVATAALQLVPAEVWAELEPFWDALAAGFVVWLGSQAFHGQEKRAAARAARR